MQTTVKFSAIIAGLLTQTLLCATPSPTTAHLQQNTLHQYSHNLLHNAKHLTAVSIVAQCKQHPPLYDFAGTNGFSKKFAINKDSLFPIGSVTKSFVSVVILQLLQEKHLNLDTPITAYFPQYPKWGKITIKQLMNMTSGIPATGTPKPNDIFRKFSAKEYQNYIKPGKILGLIYKLPMDFKPGAKYEYSNTNYTLLGLLIGKLSHNDPIEEINKRIINKLNLTHTHFVKNKLAEIPGVNKDDIVQGYDFYRKGSNPYPFQKYGQNTTSFSLSFSNYAGAIVSTPIDVNRFIHALYRPGALLSAAQLKQLTTLVSTATGQPYIPQKHAGSMGYGLGIFGVYSPKIKQMIYLYSGQVNGYQTFYIYAPSSQQYVTVSVNTSSHEVINYKDSMDLFYRLNKLCSG